MTIYCIINKLHDKVYVGQTVQPIESRYKQHVCRELANGSQNRALAEDFNKFDEFFSIIVLQHLEDNLPSNVVYEIEDYWINKMIAEGYGTYNKDGVRKEPELFVIEMEDKYGDNLLNINKAVDAFYEAYEEVPEDEEELVEAEEAFMDLKTKKIYTKLVDCLKETGVSTYAIKRSCSGIPEDGRFVYLKDTSKRSTYRVYDYLEDNSVFNHKKRGRRNYILATRSNRIYSNTEACAVGENVTMHEVRYAIKDNNGKFVKLDMRVPDYLIYHPEKSKKQVMKDAKEISTIFYIEPVKKEDITKEIKEASTKLVENVEVVEHKELTALSKKDFMAIIAEIYNKYGLNKASEVLLKFEDLF